MVSGTRGTGKWRWDRPWFQNCERWGARYEAQALAGDHDYVFIDTPPKMGLDGRPAVETADLVVIPVSSSPVDLWATVPTLELIHREKTPAILVLNRTNSRTRLAGEMIEALKKLETTAATTTIGNRVIFASSMGDGGTALESRSSGPAAAEIAGLSREISQALDAAA